MRRSSFDHFQVLGEEGDDTEHTQQICAPSESGLVHLGSPGPLTRDLDLDEPLPAFADEAGSHDCTLGPIGDQGRVWSRSEGFQRGQVGHTLEKVGLTRSVGPYEQVDRGVGSPLQLRVGAEIDQRNPLDPHQLGSDANGHQQIEEVASIAAVEHAGLESVDDPQSHRLSGHSAHPVLQIPGIEGNRHFLFFT